MSSWPVVNDGQDCFGGLHFAYLTVLFIPITCRPSPCVRLSRTPWWGVTPTTTMAAPSP